MQSIALFGATGKTGSLFLDKALKKGLAVKVLVRHPAALRIGHQRLEMIEGDVLNQADVARTLAGTDAVVSLFGHVKGSPQWLQTNGTKNIVAAMKQHGVRRVISLSGGGLPFPEKDEPTLVDKLIRTIMKIAVPKVLNDAIAHADLLRASGLDWTIVRAPRLTMKPEAGQYRIGWVGVNSSTEISRADLADFILKELLHPKFIRQMPMVSKA